MRSASLSKQLQDEMAHLKHAWECGQEMLEHDTAAGAEHQALLYAGLLILIPDGLERLRKSWILDRLDAEEFAQLPG